MTEVTNGDQFENLQAAAPSSTEPPSVAIPATAELVQNVSNDSIQTSAPIPTITAAAHAEAQGVFASLVTKLENFEHALAADARADIEKLKALLHL